MFNPDLLYAGTEDGRKILYPGTDLGVYVSKNAGETWEVLGGRGMFVLYADPVNKTEEETEDPIDLV
ncbi:MAG: hypothetical protein GY790_11660 [Bacteroidetes bacterium]|nr:hypothetical protein [Bacteroidota bacterium]